MLAPVLARPRECDRNKLCDLHISGGSASGCAHGAEMGEGGAKQALQYLSSPSLLCPTLPGLCFHLTDFPSGLNFCLLHSVLSKHFQILQNKQH